MTDNTAAPNVAPHDQAQIDPQTHRVPGATQNARFLDRLQRHQGNLE